MAEALRPQKHQVRAPAEWPYAEQDVGMHMDQWQADQHHVVGAEADHLGHATRPGRPGCAGCVLAA